jgi:replicative DNA helicase
MDNEIWSDFLKIDGEIYNIKVKVGVKRNANFLDKYANRVEDGDLKRELIGVYFNYKNINFERQKDSNYDEYNRLYNKLTEPEEFHDIDIAGFKFRAYFSDVADEMYSYKNGKPYFKNLTVNFTAKKPARS